MMFCEIQQPSAHLLANIPILKQSASIAAKLATQNYLDQRPSFILVVAGLPFTRQLLQMPLL
jgi:hypothetical protein